MLQPVRDHFKTNENARELLKKVKVRFLNCVFGWLFIILLMLLLINTGQFDTLGRGILIYTQQTSDFLLVVFSLICMWKELGITCGFFKYRDTE